MMEMRGGMKSTSYETDMRVMDRFDQKVEQVSTEMRQLQAAFKKRKRNPVVRTVVNLVSTAHSPPTSISSKVSMSMSALSNTGPSNENGSGSSSPDDDDDGS